jgi:anthranilate synthase component 1
VRAHPDATAGADADAELAPGIAAERSWAAAYAAAAARIDALAAALSRPAASAGRLAPAPAPLPLGPAMASWAARSTTGHDAYVRAVETVKRAVVEGEVVQAVPSHALHAPLRATPVDLYRALRASNPSPYMFLLDLPLPAPAQSARLTLVGASPEALVRVSAAGRVVTRPIAGTRRRGATAAEDAALATELLADEKERAEHVMLVDLGRNDVGRVARAGSVRVAELMVVERYSHVMHIVSSVEGDLAPGRTPCDAFRALFPAGTLSGSPKVRAVSLVASVERARRGAYGGAVGYWDWSGALDTAIAIRTAVVRTARADGSRRVALQAGAGVVFDSDAEAEWAETLAKMGAGVRALAALGET